MKRIFFLSLLLSLSAFAQTPQLRVRWEELTAPDFRTAIQRSGGTCLLPFGILEKHGPHLPIGTDLLNVRKASLDAAEREYAIVFPDYYFGADFRGQATAGDHRLLAAPADGTAAGDHRRDGAQRLQEDHHRQRTRREQQLPALLCPDADGEAARLCGLPVRPVLAAGRTCAQDHRTGHARRGSRELGDGIQLPRFGEARPGQVAVGRRPGAPTLA